MQPIVEVRDVRKSIGEAGGERVILDNISLSLLPGEFVAIMGPSGSGKSTLLSLVGGLATPTSGEILVYGQDITKMSHAARAKMRLTSLGYVFQEYNLVPALTVGENVALPLELAGMSASDARAHTERALEAVGLAGPSDRYPDNLSGGERQRVAIARATVGGSRIVLADEPTGALDSVNANTVMALMREVVVAGIVVTHNPSVAELADRILHLRDGCLSQQPNPRRLAASARVN